MSSFVVGLTFSFLPRLARSRVHTSSLHSPLLYLSLLSLISRAIPLSGVLIVARSLKSRLALAPFFACLHQFPSFRSLILHFVASDFFFVQQFFILFLIYSISLFPRVSHPRFFRVVRHSHISLVLSYLSDTILVSRPSSPSPCHPPRSPSSRSLARPALSAFSLHLLLSSSPSASRAHTRTARVSISLPLSPTVLCPYDEECRQRSNRSLAFARTASLLHPSAVREPTPPICPCSSPFSTSSFTFSLLNLLRRPPPPPAPLLFPQISSTIFAISITRAHLFLL